jgi:hypothetical protein
VARDYRTLPRARRKSSPFERGESGRQPGSAATFIGQVLGGMAMVWVVTWQATPMVLSLWHTVGVPPAQIARTEQSVFYAGCDEARAAGVAPIYRGSPGYREGMDGDHDGVACEPIR